MSAPAPDLPPRPDPKPVPPVSDRAALEAAIAGAAGLVLGRVLLGKGGGLLAGGALVAARLLLDAKKQSRFPWGEDGPDLADDPSGIAHTLVKAPQDPAADPDAAPPSLMEAEETVEVAVTEAEAEGWPLPQPEGSGNDAGRKDTFSSIFREETPETPTPTAGPAGFTAPVGGVPTHPPGSSTRPDNPIASAPPFPTPPRPLNPTAPFPVESLSGGEGLHGNPTADDEPVKTGPAAPQPSAGHTVFPVSPTPTPGASGAVPAAVPAFPLLRGMGNFPGKPVTGAPSAGQEPESATTSPPAEDLASPEAAGTTAPDPGKIWEMAAAEEKLTKQESVEDNQKPAPETGIEPATTPDVRSSPVPTAEMAPGESLPPQNSPADLPDLDDAPFMAISPEFGVKPLDEGSGPAPKIRTTPLPAPETIVTELESGSPPRHDPRIGEIDSPKPSSPEIKPENIEGPFVPVSLPPGQEEAAAASLASRATASPALADPVETTRKGPAKAWLLLVLLLILLAVLFRRELRNLFSPGLLVPPASSSQQATPTGPDTAESQSAPSVESETGTPAAPAPPPDALEQSAPDLPVPAPENPAPADPLPAETTPDAPPAPEDSPSPEQPETTPPADMPQASDPVEPSSPGGSSQQTSPAQETKTEEATEGGPDSEADPGTDPDAIAEPLPGVPQDFAADSPEGLAKTTVERLLSAAGVEDLNALVLRPTETLRQVLVDSPDRTLRPTAWRRILFDGVDVDAGAGGEESAGEIRLFRVVTDALPKGFPVAVTGTASGPRVDYGIFVQCRDQLLDAFMADPAARPQRFAAVLRRGHYFGDALSPAQLDELLCLEISSPNPGAERHPVFVSRESVLGTEVLRRFEWNRVYTPVLELAHSGPYVGITGIVEENWRVPRL